MLFHNFKKACKNESKLEKVPFLMNLKLLSHRSFSEGNIKQWVKILDNKLGRGAPRQDSSSLERS